MKWAANRIPNQHRCNYNEQQKEMVGKEEGVGREINISGTPVECARARFKQKSERVLTPSSVDENVHCNAIHGAELLVDRRVLHTRQTGLGTANTQLLPLSATISAEHTITHCRGRAYAGEMLHTEGCMIMIFV